MEPAITARNRLLEHEEDVFTQNAWDDIEWTEEMILDAEKKIARQKADSCQEDVSLGNIEHEVSGKWNDFYKVHGDKFFKDRQWIFSEFPELLDGLRDTSPACRMFEVGCGVGNAVAHITATNKNPRLHLYCCDLSGNAIETLMKRDLYRIEGDSIGVIDAFVADISKDFPMIRDRIGYNSLDFITMIFTLSALKPESMNETVKNLADLLKPGGLILFRDYARFDLTQLRFKGRSYLSENYYVRQDGTTSFFFTQDYVHTLFSQAGLKKIELKSDNRLLVNRLKEQKMCRCWIQAKYKKH